MYQACNIRLALAPAEVRESRGFHSSYASATGQLTRLTCGKPDKWETYAEGAVETVAFDEIGDGAPDRRLTCAAGALQFIESAPDEAGVYTTTIAVGR